MLTRAECRFYQVYFPGTDVFHRNAMDGHLILHMDDRFAAESLGIANSLKRKKLLIQVELLKRKQIRAVKVSVHVRCVMCHFV